MQTTLKELIDKMTSEIDSHPLIKDVTACTYQDLLVRVSEKKNEYYGVFIVYDLRQIALGEWRQSIPFTLIVADKLKTNRENEIFIHSNTLSLAIDIVKILRNFCQPNDLDGLSDVVVDIWTEDESDSLLAGTKIDFTLEVDLGGYCDYPTN